MRLAQQSRLDEAWDLLRPWVAAHPDDLDARAAAALVAQRRGDAAGLAEMLAAPPAAVDPRLRLLRANLELLEDRPRQALALLSSLLPEAPPAMAPDVRRLLAETLVLTGDPTAALSVLREADPRDPRMALVGAEAAYQLGDLERAMAMLRPFAEAVRVHEGGFAADWMRATAGDLAQSYGRLLVAASRPGEALPYLERALALAPEHARAWQTYGQALIGVGRTEEARRALARFAELAAPASAEPGGGA